MIRKSIREIAADATPAGGPEQPGLVRLRAACEAAALVATDGPARTSLKAGLAVWAQDLPLEAICRAGAEVLTELELIQASEAPALREALEQFMRLPHHSVRPAP